MSERNSKPAAAAAAAKWRLPAALTLSLFLHGSVVGVGELLERLRKRPPRPPSAALQATLQAAPRPPAPELRAPEAVEATPSAVKPLPPQTPSRPGAGIQADLATLASRQIAQRLLYPEEAIVRGLEGEALVMLFLDANGNSVAARLERSSGHAILDDAAVAAARQVSALPEGEPREVLLPVRFRLR